MIADGAEIIGRVEKNTHSALVISAHVLVGTHSQVGLAVAEATPIHSNQSCFDFAECGLKTLRVIEFGCFLGWNSLFNVWKVFEDPPFSTIRVKRA